jgi:hypothetical protein
MPPLEHMPSLRVHKDFQGVRYLRFCYLCGRDFVDGDVKDGDHVPPKATFNARDRQPALKLQTHRACNESFSVEDKKIAQLIALRRYQGPSSARDSALSFALYPGPGGGAGVVNLDVDQAVWRWIRGFHAALYREPLVTPNRAIVTPFARADLGSGVPKVRPLRPQHALAVKMIKYNRLSGNLDAIVANNRQLRYDCVWAQSDDGKKWFCMFGLDICDWKDLGSHTGEIPARGCAGYYALADFARPQGATAARDPVIEIPDSDPLDPFGG